VVRPGDSLTRLGSRFGVSSLLLASANALPRNARLKPGQRLQVDNRHIVPGGALVDGVVLNVPQRMLFVLQGGAVDVAYPVGLGRPDWPTPTGAFKVVSKAQDKAWIVPKSIQEEMEREGKTALSCVPPGPDNPLGKYWLGLSLDGIGIHGTIAPTSVYHFASHGCVRLHSDDIAVLYDKVELGTRGKIVYEPVLLAALADGRILVEVHPDVYSRGDEPMTVVRDLAFAHGLKDKIDWQRVDRAIQERAGLAREVRAK
jgi:L,D-transpeptidase ErfK/SrfK